MIAWSRNVSVLSVTKIRDSRTPVVFVLQSRLKLVARKQAGTALLLKCATQINQTGAAKTHMTQEQGFFSTKRET